MATTIPTAFEGLRSNLELTGLQKSTVSERQKNVREAVEKDITVLESFLTGSYSRSTLIGPLSEADIDILFVLDSSYFQRYKDKQNGGQAGLLDLVKRTLLKTYLRTPDISRNGQAVTIRFSDFLVDVVPAFRRQGGGYLIPNSISQTWISTDPQKHVELVSQANKVHSGNLVPLIKMIKGWNKTSGQFFQSFHLEVLVLSVLEGVTISSFSSGARFIFDKSRDLVTKQNPDPAGYGGDVGAYIATEFKIKEAVSKFQLAYDRALEAEILEARGDTSLAVDRWRKIFGNYFPFYG